MNIHELMDKLEIKQKELTIINDNLAKWNKVATSESYGARIELINMMKNIIEEIEKLNEEIENY